MKEFLHNVHDSTSISSPGVHYLAEDQKGQIWASTMYGINLLDRRTGTFKRFQPDIKSKSSKGRNNIKKIHMDQKNRLWAVGARNIFLFDLATGAFKLIQEVKNPDKKYVVKSILETNEGAIWCGTNDGLLKIESGDTVFTHVPLMVNSNNKDNPDIIDIDLAELGYFWLVKSEGLWKYNAHSGELITDVLPVDFIDKKIKSLTRRTKGIFFCCPH